ncbi:MAG: hypothetical protein GAK30_01159 [Paracidovorax wautersii]|uniref:Acetyl-CoA carboxylase biotin carboxyl carrier protein n=1 Tax=Paracidovorax wautersii TaxID=1177982 RepID=A0A7V8FQH0_9BURK|nr:MAG: hypothetical protein GAK30_01159 [Paracidovorax wautersii]
MQAKDIATLSAWLAATDIDVLELDGPHGHLRLDKNAAATATAPTSAPAAPAPDPTCAVRAASPGIWRDRWPGHGEPQVPAGARVQAGDLLGLLQIGPLLLPVRAPCSGRLSGWRLAPGATTGHGTHLADITPSAST